MSGQIFCLGKLREGVIMCAKALIKYLYGKKLLGHMTDQVHQELNQHLKFKN